MRPPALIPDLLRVLLCCDCCSALTPSQLTTVFLYHPPMRPRLLLHRCGLAILILIALTWFISRWRGLYWCGTNGANTYRVEFASGRVRLAHDYYAPRAFSPPWRLTAWTSGWVFVPTSRDATRLWLWNFHYQDTPGLHQLYIPLWSLMAMPAVPLTIAAIRRRRTLKHAHNTNPCPHCSYNLTGLAPNSPCPECGRTR